MFENWGLPKPKISQQMDIYIAEENRVKNTIINILSKEGTTVSMAPVSNVYIITNELIDTYILIDGSAEFIKMNKPEDKYGWKFRQSFINDMIQLAIEWIEEDRADKINKIFVSEMNILERFNNVIDILKDKPKKEIISNEI